MGRQLAVVVEAGHDEQLPRSLSNVSRVSLRLFVRLLSPSGGLESRKFVALQLNCQAMEACYITEAPAVLRLDLLY